MMKVLVLCTGNACRSQMAEAYLNFFATHQARFYSAGLVSNGLHPLTVQVMAEDNIDILHYSSKSYRTFSGMHFDWLITVCDEVNRQLPKTLSFDRHLHFSIPDPSLCQASAEECLEHFRNVQETVKKSMLKFIGQHLIGVEKAAVA